MKKKRAAQSAFFNLRASIALLVCGAAACSMLSGALLAFFSPEVPTKPSERALTFAERVNYQRAIEEVYWRHRIWPRNGGERPGVEPSLDAVMSQAQIEKKVADYLRKSQMLEDYWHRPLTAEQLQAEIDRMATHTKQPEVLRELFEALGNDPFIIAGCLARPALAERTLATVASVKEPLRSWQSTAANRITKAVGTPSITDTPPPPVDLNTGGRYNPATDSWLPTNTNAPSARHGQTAVWTGSEMIIWGGWPSLNTGARYNPSTDSWTEISTTNAPAGRFGHTAVWTGSEMIVWGGTVYGSGNLNTGGRYNPSMTPGQPLAPPTRPRREALTRQCGPARK